jgi:hypothetical protein
VSAGASQLPRRKCHCRRSPPRRRVSTFSTVVEPSRPVKKNGASTFGQMSIGQTTFGQKSFSSYTNFMNISLDRLIKVLS